MKLKKAKVVLNLRVLSIPDKVQISRSLINSLKSSTLKQPEELLSHLEKDIQDLEVAYADALVKRNDSVTQTAVMDQKEMMLDNRLGALGNYVEMESEGDEALIKSAGFSVKKSQAKAAIPMIPAALAASEGADVGSIALKWKTVKGSKSYLVRATTTVADVDSWKQVAVCTKSNTTVVGLVSGQQYWFQVSAVGSAGQGPWSDPATKMVP